MNVLIIHKSIAKQYLALQNKIRYSQQFKEYSKSWLVILWFLFCLGIYIYFVNQASTLGYFYSQEKSTRDAAQFSYNIQAFETTRIYENLWKSVMEGNKYLGTPSTYFSLKNAIYPIE